MAPDRDDAAWPYEAGPTAVVDEALVLQRAFATCFRGADGALAIDHLRRVFLDRRLGPSASDAELRHTEGQRSVIAHILSLVERGRG